MKRRQKPNLRAALLVRLYELVEQNAPHDLDCPNTGSKTVIYPCLAHCPAGVIFHGVERAVDRAFREAA